MNGRIDGVRGWLVFVLVAGLGAAGGLVLTARRASGCSCVEPQWRVELRSVAADPPGVTHARYWPTAGQLMSYPGAAHIWAVGGEDGQAHRVGAGR